MSTERAGVPCRVVVASAVRGLCMDCHEEFAGELVLMLVFNGGTMRVEVGVASGDQLHALARVPLHLIPCVKV